MKKRLGFTLIEVSLFLAISGLLFVGVTIGVQNSIYQQRRNDTVQDFAEFLRGVFDGVLNVQNDVGGGKSEQAIYGKLVTFGETRNLAGADNKSGDIFVYTVVGDIDNISSNDGALTRLKDLGANVKNNEDILAGYPYSYTPKWSAQIEPACTDNHCDRSQLKGMWLVVRHPDSGVVTSYFTNNVVDIKNVDIKNGYSEIFDKFDDSPLDPQVDFCIDSEPGNQNSLRADVRVLTGSRNGSGIEIYGENDKRSLCK